MTDKVQKIREEVVRLKSQLLKGACSSQIAMETRCKEEAYDEVLTLLDSLQEEHDRIVDELIYGKEPKLVNVDDLPVVVDAPPEDYVKGFAVGRLYEQRQKSKTSVWHDANEKPKKKCMFASDNFNDEDRKVTCDGCEEECIEKIKEERKRDPSLWSLEDFENNFFEIIKPYKDSRNYKNLCIRLLVWRSELWRWIHWKKRKEEPVSEDLEEAAKEHAVERYRVSRDEFLAEKCKWSFKAGAKWQKKKDEKWFTVNHKQIFNNGYEEGFEAGRDDMEEQMMKGAIEAKILSTDEGTIKFSPFDRKLLKEIRGKVKLIIIKED